MTFPDFVQRDVSLKPFNTFGMDVSAKAYLKVESEKDLARVFASSELMALPRLVIGGGSNLLLTKRFEGLVLHMHIKGIRLLGEDESNVYFRAGAGEVWHDMVSWTLANGLGGLENLSWIPGTVGAAPVQNIGAYGLEVRDRIHSLTAFDFETGETVRLDRDACQFSYRNSIFKHAMKDRLVIIDVKFAMPKKWQANRAYADVERELASLGIANPTPGEMGETIVRIRKRKLPSPDVLGNAGSFFKNPTVTAERLEKLRSQHPDMPAYAQADGNYRIAAGWLIDRCGWKGYRKGDAGVCENQALVLVNYGKASGNDILELARAIQQDVYRHYAIELEPEPVFI